MSFFLHASTPVEELHEVIREIRRLRAACLGEQERRRSMHDLEKVLARHEEALVKALPAYSKSSSLLERLTDRLTMRIKAGKRRVEGPDRLRAAYRRTLSRRAPLWLEELLWKQFEEVTDIFAKTRRIRTA